MRFEILTVVSLMLVLSLVWEPYGFVGRCWSDKLLQPWRWRQHVSPKCWHRPRKPHGSEIEDNTNITLGNVHIVCQFWYVHHDLIFVRW